MGSSQSSRRVNDEAIAGDVVRFLFLISTMNGRVESFMIVRRGERWTSPAISGERARCMITVGLCLRSARRWVRDSPERWLRDSGTKPLISYWRRSWIVWEPPERLRELELML